MREHYVHYQSAKTMLINKQYLLTHVGSFILCNNGLLPLFHLFIVLLESYKPFSL